MPIGLDVGTSFLIKAIEAENGLEYTEFRDAFYKLKPVSKMAGKLMAKGLQGVSHYQEADGTYVVVGKDAIAKAIERHDSALRPLSRGVISPKEPDARRVLKYILSQLVGSPKVAGDLLVYSIPAQPIDQDEDNFNTGFHEDVLKRDLGDLGWKVSSLNEAEAICFAELEDSDFTGVSLSCGAGMVNVCVMSSGDAVLKFSITKSGDWIDRMVAQSIGLPDSIVQLEKESGDLDLTKTMDEPILQALSIYYERLISYLVAQLSARLSSSTDIPRFSTPIPVIIAGGTSRAKGFLELFKQKISQSSLPFEIKEVRYAKDPLRSVAKGCLLAASMF